MVNLLSRRTRTLGTASIAIVALATLAACTAPNQPPQQVRAETPRVTYNYRGEDEQMQANRRADEFCSRYQSVERTVRVTAEANGTTTAEYECISAPAPIAVAPQRPIQPTMTYSFRTDQELLDASRSAQSQCAPSPMPMTSTVMIDGNGNRTVTFQCGRG